MNTTELAPQTTTSRTRAPWSTELVGAGAAVVCALVLWTTLVPLGGVDLSADMGGSVKQIGALDVGLTALGAGLIGLLALRVLERFTPKARTIWTITALVVLVLSYAGAVMATNTAAMWSLIGLHSLVAAVVIAVGVRSRR
ncbi:DUF6069 family protein [Micropruina sp.]|uniref:DUF6069 family protein n=1 Tax=Micropruina sp. TaxID=2737536 RepID=UPI0039E6387C